MVQTSFILDISFTKKDTQDNDPCPLLCCRIVEAGYNLGPDGLFYALERVSIFNKKFFNSSTSFVYNLQLFCKTLF